ncbi:MAG TPA: YggT family protein [Spirochaetales bacterium]|nr:YggT family protein [Spirochaetales bacterium]HPD79429.1 YggT family protein [Spirochaetales bacterium]HQK33162.1 YggT family protein [Spirochaetales bacterium]HRV28107.1 YggT family protein [Spirochaetia bacterium]
MIGIVAVFLNLLIFFIQVYSLFIIVYIVLSWIPNSEIYPIRTFLGRFTEPFLNIFSNRNFFTAGSLDFGPLVALIVLSITRSLLILLLIGKFTILAIVYVMISTLWDPVAFFMTLYLICISIRYAGFIFAPHSLHPFWHALDILINPVLAFISRKIFPNRIIKYETSLFTTLIILIVLRFGIGSLMNLLGKFSSLR